MEIKILIQRNIINNAVESVTNALMTNLTNQINRDPSSNAFVAEYSFLIPALSNNSSNNTQIITNNLILILLIHH